MVIARKLGEGRGYIEKNISRIWRVVQGGEDQE